MRNLVAFSAVFICVIYFAWPANAADKAAKGPKVTDKVTFPIQGRDVPQIPYRRTFRRKLSTSRDLLAVLDLQLVYSLVLKSAVQTKG